MSDMMSDQGDLFPIPERKLFLLTQTIHTSYDTYDSCLVCAKTEEDAKRIHPRGETDWREKDSWDTSWANNPSQVRVQTIGYALPTTPDGVIIASFNAG